MSIIIPPLERTNNIANVSIDIISNEHPDIREIRKRVIQDALNMTLDLAVEEFRPQKYDPGVPTGGIVIVELFPHHFDRTESTYHHGWWLDTAEVSAAAWTAWIDNSALTNESAYYLIVGMFIQTSTPTLTTAYFTVDGKQQPPFDLNIFKAIEENTIYFDEPVLLHPEQVISLTVRSVANVATDEDMGLVGWAVGKFSNLIKESDSW
jgi:hypothetical protein